MIRSVRDNKDNKKKDPKLDRSRSRSPANSKANLKGSSKLKNSSIKLNAKSNIKLNRSRSKSPQRSLDGKNKKGNKDLKKSKSQKKLNRSLSQSKVSIGKKQVPNASSSKKISKTSTPISKTPLPAPKSKTLVSSPIQKQPGSKVQKPLPKPSTQVSNLIKPQQKQMGLLFLKPQHDKMLFKSLEPNDQVFQKYHDMISNDNDTHYVTNAFSELITMKKDDDSAGRDFVTGKIARMSGVFDNLTLDKVINATRKLPQYYSGQCGKNLQSLKLVLQTKFKVEVDLGFLLYSTDGDKLTIFRIYVSKIYRKMNYLGFIYIEIFKMLMSKHSCDRWSIFILQRNVNVHKFFKYLGFKIEKIATESKNKVVDYFQEFTMKRKELNTVLSAMKG